EPSRVVGRFISDDPLPLGSACSAANDCLSGFCADGVCCDSDCGGGAVDCLACSTAAGGAINGTCGNSVLGAPCRSAAGLCDLPEVCPGGSPVCPADGALPDMSACGMGGTCMGGTCVGSTGGGTCSLR